MADIKKQCRTCRYWKSAHGFSEKSLMMCHYLLATNTRRVEVDGVCKSHAKRDKK